MPRKELTREEKLEQMVNWEPGDDLSPCAGFGCVDCPLNVNGPDHEHPWEGSKCRGQVEFPNLWDDDASNMAVKKAAEIVLGEDLLLEKLQT